MRFSVNYIYHSTVYYNVQEYSIIYLVNPT